MKKIYCVLILIAVLLIGVGAFVGVSIIKSPEYALMQIKNDVQKSGIDGLMPHLTDDAQKTVSAITSVTENQLVGALFSLFAKDDYVGALKSNLNEIDWRLDDVLKSKNKADAVLGFNYKDKLTGTIEISMVYEDGEWKISGIEIPEAGVDYYLEKDVPHGAIEIVRYDSKLTGAVRECYVYLPPQYLSEPDRRFPVLYLMHGAGENETGWATQGMMGNIMDNLIAEGGCEPMIIVCEHGVANLAGAEPAGGFNLFNFDAFEKVMVEECVPVFDSRLRTIADRDHRAICGLSLGGFQAYTIGLNHPELFGWIGGFSGSGRGPMDRRDAEMYPKSLNDDYHLFYISIGTDEPAGMYQGIYDLHVALENLGVNHVYYESPGTGHEWLTWRRSLHQFAPMLFTK